MTHTHDHSTEHLAELLALDAEVLGGYLDELGPWTRSLAPADVRTVVDLGAGTGVGSLALARRFPSAEVVAVDRSAEMLQRTLSAAASAGVAERVRAVPADLDDGWPSATGRADVVWASSSLHEVGDPDRLLREVLAALPPGGLLVVVEMDALPQVLPSGVAPGLASRCAEALIEAGWNAHPDWRPHLSRAGFEVVAQRTVTSESAADGAATARYRRAWLGHVRRALEGVLAADDLTALDRLLGERGPDAVLDRDDPVRGSRTAWAARRPVRSSHTGGSR